MAFERPLQGEPLGLDLLNTTWNNRGSPRDLLDDLAGTPARDALRTARAAILAHVDDPGSTPAREALNQVLAWGRSRPALGPDGPTSAAELADPAHRVGWLAAVSYLDLLRAGADRIRRCAHPDCVLHFYDTSPKRSRRWCSMAGCGNRAKAARHYARTHRDPG
jgi:predicted RNA-binding Zn ribbon-like protein